MPRFIAILVALFALPCFAVESKPIEKDGVAVSVVVRPPIAADDDQPRFSVRFTNRTADYVDLYDVEDYSNWQIQFTATDKDARDPGPWQLRMDKSAVLRPIAHKQIKAGESLDVDVNLNDPPLTFDFVYMGIQKHLVAPVRRLSPGRYQLSLTITLQTPFGPGHHRWGGPLTTDPVEIELRPAGTNGKQAPPTTQEVSAYDTAIDQVTTTLRGRGGLWTNGACPSIALPPNANPEDVIASAVNGYSLGSKAYRILRIRPFEEQPNASAALMIVGKTPKVLIFFPSGQNNWWTRFYDTQLESQ